MRLNAGAATGTVTLLRWRVRHWFDEGNTRRLPKGEYGVDAWVNDAATVARVREVYPPSEEVRATIENDRRIYLTAIAKIKQDMILGADKNSMSSPPFGPSSGRATSTTIR